MNYPTVIIGGATASRKTELAIAIAKKFPSVIINADSLQVYKDFSILTNRPNNKECQNLRFRLFGLISPPESPNLGWWRKLVIKELKRANSENILPIIVGGTGLYINSLENNISKIPDVKIKVRNQISKILKKKGLDFLYKKLQKLDSISYKKLNKNDKQRILRAIEVKVSTGKTIDFWKTTNTKEEKVLKKYFFIVIKEERKILYDRIDKRFKNMLKYGVLDEVNSFLIRQVDPSHPIYKVIGLKNLIKFLQGELDIETAIQLSQKDTRNYAKRQITWFKNQPKNAIHLEFNEALKFIFKNLN